VAHLDPGDEVLGQMKSLYATRPRPATAQWGMFFYLRLRKQAENCICSFGSWKPEMKSCNTNGEIEARLAIH
jgi:hypothetical protein